MQLSVCLLCGDVCEVIFASAYKLFLCCWLCGIYVMLAMWYSYSVGREEFMCCLKCGIHVLLAVWHPCAVVVFMCCWLCAIHVLLAVSYSCAVGCVVILR